jgi:hypothetical protein
MSSLIVGIDPGITTGVAVFDMQGHLLLAESRRNFRLSEIRKFILERGRPLIIASDMNPLPRSIEKIASSFSARVVFPEGVLTKKSKRRIAGDFLKKWNARHENGLPWKNRHEKDALVAGWYAWKRIRRTVSKMEKRFKDSELMDIALEDIFLKGKQSI